MISVNDSHLKAIARAIHFVRSGITTQMTPKLRESVELDITKLDEVHKFCRQQIIEPGLPLAKIPDTILKVGESLGTENPPSSN